MLALLYLKCFKETSNSVLLVESTESTDTRDQGEEGWGSNPRGVFPVSPVELCNIAIRNGLEYTISAGVFLLDV